YIHLFLTVYTIDRYAYLYWIISMENSHREKEKGVNKDKLELNKREDKAREDVVYIGKITKLKSSKMGQDTISRIRGKFLSIHFTFLMISQKFIIHFEKNITEMTIDNMHFSSVSAKKSDVCDQTAMEAIHRPITVTDSEDKILGILKTVDASLKVLIYCAIRKEYCIKNLMTLIQYTYYKEFQNLAKNPGIVPLAPIINPVTVILSS
ncbi:hypothetical protein L9F63_006614, partial [Diploptera punctata]